MSPRKFFLREIILSLVFALAHVGMVSAQTTSFSYQGRITDGGTAANGIYDMQFKLFDSSGAGSGNQIGSTVTNSAVMVTNGVFTVPLDYGAAAFSGADRYLEIGLRLAGSPNPYTVLAPRQQVISTPYAIRSATTTQADTATNAQQLGGVAANQYVQTGDTRLSDSRTPTAGSTNYIQNTTSQQASSNFNISGTGAASIFDAGTQYNLGGARILSNGGLQNLFAGTNAGVANAGSGNSFYGFSAGSTNSNGNNNSFFGGGAGKNTTTGSNNNFFGYFAGAGNTTGVFNSFYGTSTGVANTTGSSNSFFGFGTGLANKTGGFNSFFGRDAGAGNVDGSNNAFFGYGAGKVGVSVSDTAFFGANAGAANTAPNNSFFGSSAGKANTTGFDNSFFGSGAGSGNTTGTTNSFFGSSAGSANDTASGNSYFGFHAGTVTTSDANSFFGASAGETNTTGDSNSFFGNQAGPANIDGQANAFFGHYAGRFNHSGSYNTFVGASAGQQNQSTSFNTYIGGYSGKSNNFGTNNVALGYASDILGTSNSTAIGAYAMATDSNSVVLGGISGVNGGTDTNVGIGTPAPKAKLDVRGGNVFIGHPNSLIITSPNGACWFITVSNTGVLSTVSAACP
jgi:hypothetical protein